MTDAIKDGGPAFPRENYMGHEGMSLRDYFAGQALTVMERQDPSTGYFYPSKLASWSYELADAMLAASQEPRK